MGFVYTLDCPNGQYYIGSTLSLQTRLIEHRYDSRRHPDLKVYKNILANGGWDNVKIVLVQECDNYKQVEGDMIRNSLADPLCLNLIRAALTEGETVEEKKVYNKSYYETNREAIRTQQKAYYLEKKQRETACTRGL